MAKAKGLLSLTPGRHWEHSPARAQRTGLVRGAQTQRGRQPAPQECCDSGGGCLGLLRAGVLPEGARPRRGAVQGEGTCAQLGAPRPLLRTAGAPGSCSPMFAGGDLCRLLLCVASGSPESWWKTLVRFGERKVWVPRVKGAELSNRWRLDLECACFSRRRTAHSSRSPWRCFSFHGERDGRKALGSRRPGTGGARPRGLGGARKRRPKR